MMCLQKKLQRNSIRVRVAQQALKQAQKEYEHAVNQTLQRRERIEIKHRVPEGTKRSRYMSIAEEPRHTHPTEAKQAAKSRAYSIPSTRFKSQNQEEDDSFYLGLPAPWNIVPDAMGGDFKSLVNLQKTSLVPLFDGKPDHYSYFRDSFIMAVHCTSAGVFAKDLLLRQSLKSCDNMQKLLALAPREPPGTP